MQVNAQYFVSVIYHMKGLSTDTNQRKEEGIVQESMQSGNTPNRGHHM